MRLAEDFTKTPSLNTYLLCNNTQQVVTILGRQFTIYQILEALGQAITDAAFCFDSAAQ